MMQSAAARSMTQGALDQMLRSNRPANGQRIVPVGAPGGLDLVIPASGPGRWRYRYRPRGTDPATGGRFTQRSLTLGTTATHSLAEARRDAAELRLRVTKGEDPAVADRAEAKAKRAAVVEAGRREKIAAAARATCATRLDEYAAVLAARGRSEKHQRQEQAQVRLALSSVKLLDAAPVEITTAHVERVMAACPVRSRVQRFGALDRFLRWATRAGGGAPATAAFGRHERPSVAPPRQRVLASAEIAAVWRATGTLDEAVLRDLVRFLVAVPCRESEAAAMRWRDVDLAGRCWTMPTSKNGLPHRFPLPDRAVAVLAARRAAAGDAPKPDGLVFPPPREAETTARLKGRAGKAAALRPYNSWSSLKRALDRRLVPGASARVQAVTVQPVVAWRLHDLRRSAATAMGEAGYDEALIDLILNHKAARSRGGVTGVYNVSQRWAERTAALTAWNRHIGEALGEATGGAPGAVIALPTARRTA